MGFAHSQRSNNKSAFNILVMEFAFLGMIGDSWSEVGKPVFIHLTRKAA